MKTIYGEEAKVLVQVIGEYRALLREAYEAIVNKHLPKRDEDGLEVCRYCWRPPEIHKKACVVLKAQASLEVKDGNSKA